MANNNKVLSIETVAEMIESNPRAIRRVLRSITPRDAQPGRGGRWTIRESDIETLRNAMRDSSHGGKTVTADLSALSVKV